MSLPKRALHYAPLHHTRWSCITSFDGRRRLSHNACSRLAEPVQSYVSTSQDPYVNLSIEHYFLQRTAPESAVLFLYVNRPSIIIGRNQNPWLEVNLALLDPGRGESNIRLGGVDLVRRRSGGGTVFHDQGNVNWTVICPPKHFTRDKHAEMVVRALRGCGVDRSRVNERHDIVLDQGQRGAATNEEDTHLTPYQSTDAQGPRALKVSGSAYKLTRQRALHHGTCLLNSPNLNIIPDYLHSPAKPFISAKGVESVSSPVGNILISNEDFIANVQKQFRTMYGTHDGLEEVSDAWLEHAPIRKGHHELKSSEWTYLQTPQFTISKEPEWFADLIPHLTVRNGAIAGGHIWDPQTSEIITLSETILGRRIHEVSEWSSALDEILRDKVADCARTEKLAKWLQRMLPPPKGR
ncbi:hypothetical protein EJ03DRAFT_377554 [Teratosphaeria nubilosa]|uniref:Putative lipoate-protein ligase A n=1 Tax=Teratosphaeria nubilosa TaxID=161662 RepID=A0A6G1KZX3_9PEZI|nr:hypothetical protein EJ03DRAFT_377554 [Teratosphaeria nubilosa]